MSAPLIPCGWRLVKQSRLDEMSKLAVDPSERAYQGRNLWDERQVHRNWDMCTSNLSGIAEELDAITKGWDDDELRDAIAKATGSATS